MSRSTFAAQFRAVSGEPPLTYLHRWRRHLARAALRDTDSTVAALAAELGYASESSFSHAFTRTGGISPAAIAACTAEARRQHSKSAKRRKNALWSLSELQDLPPACAPRSCRRCRFPKSSARMTEVVCTGVAGPLLLR